MKTETIAAIITPLGTGGVAGLRLSGAKALEIANKMFEATTEGGLKPRIATYGKIKATGFFDEGLAIYFKAPSSFTGEDCVEFFTHGGTHIAKGVLEACLKNGARMAENGEFSKRAVLNGKMDLAQAEGIVDMINATSDAGVRAGFSQLQGGLSRRIAGLQDKLTGVLAEIEVTLDFPEHDIEVKTLDELILNPLITVRNELASLIETSKAGRMIKHGVSVAIVGLPNAGKSSLLNAMLGYERAIVSGEKGTTRDVVTESYSYNGVQFILSDTAGLRESDNAVEKMGIARTFDEIERADIVLYLLDSETGVTADDERLLKMIAYRPHLVVASKSDKAKIESDINPIVVSSKTSKGISELKGTIFDIVFEGNKVSTLDEVYITSLRHMQAMSASLNSIKTAINKLSETRQDTLDMLSIYVRTAWLALGEVTGTTSNEAVLDAVFSKFCLGK